MKNIKDINKDILADDFRMKGTDEMSAIEAFSMVEKATKQEMMDMSTLTFLSPITQTEKMINAAYLDGEQEIVWNGEKFVLEANMINVKTNSEPGLSTDYPILVNGGIYHTPVAANDESIYFMANSSLHQMKKATKVDFTGKREKNFFRDCSFANQCANMDGEVDVTMVYREKNGIKKVVGCFANGCHTPSFSDILDAANYASIKSGRKYQVKTWEITQYFRKVEFVSRNKGEKAHILEFTWSDCGQKGLSVSSCVRGGKRKPESFDALKASAWEAALAD